MHFLLNPTLGVQETFCECICCFCTFSSFNLIVFTDQFPELDALIILLEKLDELVKVPYVSFPDLSFVGVDLQSQRRCHTVHCMLPLRKSLGIFSGLHFGIRSSGINDSAFDFSLHYQIITTGYKLAYLFHA